MKHDLKTLEVVLRRNPKEALNELNDLKNELREMKEEISSDVQSCSYLCRENLCPLKKQVLGEK